MKLKHCRKACIAVVFSGLFGSVDVWAANPVNVVVLAKFRHDEELLTAEIPVANAGYLADEAGWCAQNHRTCAGNKYNHSHIPTEGVIPCDYTWFDEDGEHTIELTALVVEDGYTVYYARYGFELDRSTSVDATTNCHNCAMLLPAPAIHSEDLGVPSDVKGVTLVRTDEGWKPTTRPAAGGIYSRKIHSARIVSVSMCNASRFPLSVRDKTESSPVYSRSFTEAEQDVFAEVYPGANLYSK